MKASDYIGWRPWVLWLGYFLLLLACAMPQGMRTELVKGTCEAPGGPVTACFLNPLSTNADIISLFQTSDAAFIARRAKEIVNAGDWGHVSLWPFWPPGMVALETVCYAISPGMPVALVLVLIVCAVWAGVLAQAAGILRAALINARVALLLPLLLLLSSEFTYFLHLGLFYTESLSIAFFLLGLGFLFRALRGKGHRPSIAAGIAFALSAYMRAQTDLVMSVTLGLSCLALAAMTMRRRHGLSPAAVKSVFLPSRLLVCVAVALLVYQALTFPYRAAHQMQWIGFSESPIWHAVWERERDLPPVLQFYREGGALAGCAVDPDLCERIHAERAAHGEKIYTIHDYFHFTLQTVLHHPVKWLAFKLSYLNDFWWRDRPESALLSVLLLGMLACALRDASPARRLTGLFLLAGLIGITGPLLLIHIEPRYLYQLRLLIMYAAILAPAASGTRRIR